MAERKRQRFEKQGLLAIEPRAFLDLFFEREELPPFQLMGDVAVIDVCGPLEHHAGWWCTSYDELVDAVDAALASSATSVVLRMDSPGGVVSGLFDAARRIRAKAKLAEKPLISYVEGMGCSAAYALASAASRIVCSESAIVGSIGIIDTRLDLTASDQQEGIQFSFITSGSRKADGHPHKAFTPEELADKQLIVDHLASLFFNLVKENRGVDAKPLDARIFVGTSARDVGLVDDVQTFEGLLATIASGGVQMASKFEEAKSALEEAAKGEGEDAEKAKRTLKFLSECDDDMKSESDEEESDDEKSDDDGPPPGDDEDEETEKEEMEGSSASTTVDLAALVTELSAKVAKLETNNEASERAALLASRPDLPKELVAVLKDKPLAEVQTIVKAMPRKGVKKAAAEASAKGTLGEGQQSDPALVASQQAPEQANALRARMGLVPTARGIKQDAYKLELGASVPVAAGKGK